MNLGMFGGVRGGWDCGGLDCQALPGRPVEFRLGRIVVMLLGHSGAVAHSPDAFGERVRQMMARPGL